MMASRASRVWRTIHWTVQVLAFLVAASNGHASPDQADIDRVRETLSNAVLGNRGRVELKYAGPLPPGLVEIVATGFKAEQGDAATGVTAELATQIRCGYRSSDYSRRLVDANRDKFDGQVTKGEPGKSVSLSMPACLVASTIHAHRVSKDETAQTLALKYYKKNVVTDEFCQMLLAANARDICAASRDKKLQIDDIVRIVLPSLEWQYQELNGLAFRALRIVPGADIDKLAALLVEASEKGRLQVLPQVAAELIVPAQGGACAIGARPPFDPVAVSETFLRPNLKNSEGRNRYARVGIKWEVRTPTVGIIDTGLYGSVLTRLQADSGGPPDLSSLSGTIASTGDFSEIEPSESDDYAGHGTHVSGLVLGGSAFWNALVRGKQEGPLGYMFGYLPKLIFIKVSSLGAYHQPPSISADVVRRALEHMYKDVHIINFSHKAPFSESLKEKLVSIVHQDKFVVSAAGNDSENMDEYSADEPQLSAMLSGDAQKFFITVGASNGALTAPATFSNKSSRMVDLFAPGTCLESFGNGKDGNDYVSLSGTSQAAPLVTFTLTLLQQMMMPRRELKFRILDTVDYAPGFSDSSISGGVLNIPKALDFFDDVVVFNKSEKGAYVRGRLVMVTPDQKEHPDAYLCLPPRDDAPRTLAHNTLLRSSRRIVMVGEVAKVVPEGNKVFKYYDCPFNPDLRFRLKNTNLPDFSLSEVREIVPRPNWWLKAEK